RVVRPEGLTAALARNVLDADQARKRKLDPNANLRPRVLVLCNVPSLTSEQNEAVGRFLEAGGGVLVTLGGLIHRRPSNARLFRRGDGWLPTTLEEPTGNEYEPPPADENKPDPTAHPLPSSFTHPALELFRGESSGLRSARFPRWWKVTAPAQGAAATTV